MRINTYLSFDGTTREALTFYRGLLGGELTAMMKFSEMPGCEALAEAVPDGIMHGCLDLGAMCIMGTDATPEHPYAGIEGAHVVIDVDDPARAAALFEALASGGAVRMPLGPTPWARQYGILVDRFGVPWMINCT
ncbi:MAG: VOC family protein [Myxococcales bacterium]|nr:VOC family protein [Myxococcales bacterium]